jgi:hypothetical protein
VLLRCKFVVNWTGEEERSPMGVRELEAAYYECYPQGHYFDPGTMGFFGSRDREARRVGGASWIYTERQENSGRWLAALFDLDPGSAPAGGAPVFFETGISKHEAETRLQDRMAAAAPDPDGEVTG